MKTIAISQSNYIPWKGYFDLINSVDEFIFFDEMQYTKRDWRNRNKIKTLSGSKWISIDVESKGSFSKKINEIEVNNDAWRKKHWFTISQAYSKAPFFKEFRGIFEYLYMECQETNLTQINFRFIREICEMLNIKTKLKFSRDYGCIDGKTERLVDLCLKAGADTYLSGPAAKSYIDRGLFSEKGIYLEWMLYDNYSEYPQLHGDFTHFVSILDLLFNTGIEGTKSNMLSFR